MNSADLITGSISSKKCLFFSWLVAVAPHSGCDSLHKPGDLAF